MGSECIYRPPPPQHTGTRIETTRGPRKSPTMGPRRGGHNSESRGGTVESSSGRRQTAAHSRDRGSRSGSISEGHQSPDDDGESKKKVDWYDLAVNPTKQPPTPPESGSSDGSIACERGGGSPPRSNRKIVESIESSTRSVKMELTICAFGCVAAHLGV